MITAGFFRGAIKAVRTTGMVMNTWLCGNSCNRKDNDQEAGKASAAVGSDWEEGFVSRTIFHVDVNSAFLSWSALEQLKEKPGSVDLRTIPSAVGGDVQTRHGIITAKSIPAKAYHILKGIREVTNRKHCKELGAYHCKGFDTFGPFKLVGGISKGHPTKEETDQAVLFYRNLSEK